jgi:hypothetical protein
MKVPDYDLQPVPAVHAALALLRDILESQHDNAFAVVVDKRAMHAKVFFSLDYFFLLFSLIFLK